MGRRKPAPYDESDATDLRERYERLRLLYEVSTNLQSTLEPDAALKKIICEAVRLVDASSGSVVLVNPNTGFMEIHAAEGLSTEAEKLRLRVGEGITGWVARHGKPARVPDVSQDPRYVMVRPEVRSELAVPLELEGEFQGVLNVDSDEADAFSAADQELLEGMARQAARVIHQTWLYEQLRLKVRLFESLSGVSQAINSALNLDDALSVITREACSLMRGKMSSLMLLDESGQWLDLRAHYGAGAAYLRKPRLEVSESLIGTVLRRKKPLQVENVQTSSGYQNVEVARVEGLVSLLSVPLLYAERPTGVLNIYTGEPYTFSNEEVRILAALAALSAIAIEKARLYERVVDVEEQLRRNEKLSALGLLAAEVAHEIRNPLNVMKLLYHSLELKFAPEDPRDKDARVIEEKMEQLNRIVERILQFARTSEPQMAPVNLNELVHELGLLVRHKLKQQQVQLNLALAPTLPGVLGEKTQLEQAFLNLTLNAVEAMGSGGILTITSREIQKIESPAQPGLVAVEFQDTGPGMSEEAQRSSLGSVFRTTKPTGTGLGLAIVRRIVETHRGRLEISSRPGHGTTVAIVLPSSSVPLKL